MRPILSIASASAVLFLGMVSPSHATMPTAAGTLPVVVMRAFDDGLFDLPVHAAGLRTNNGPQIVWRIPLVLVSFSDEALSYGPQDFDLALFDTTLSTATGSVFDYYRWVSGGRVSVQGSVVAVR